jgi:hypothetical protein
MNAREQRQYDEAHDVADEGPWCPCNGIPAQYCPRECSHDEELEGFRAESERTGIAVEVLMRGAA